MMWQLEQIKDLFGKYGVENVEDLENRLNHRYTMKTDAMDELRAFRASGLSPERCAELAKVEKDGRLVQLPVSLGQLVYCLHHKYNHVLKGFVYQIDYEDGNVDFRRNNSFCVDCSPEIEVGTKNWLLYLHYIADDIGKTVFLTREEAEKALESEGENG